MSYATTVVLLFSLATGVALVARRIRIPYTVALVLAGLLLGATGEVPRPNVHLTKELLYSTLLPGLLFEAAFHLDAKDFWRNKLAVLSLAIPGVVLAISITTAILVGTSHILALAGGFGLTAATVFAAMVAATDPIAVVALFKTLGAPARLRVVVEGESLVNDGTAVVLSAILVGAAGGAATTTLASAAFDFVRVVGLGVLVGGALGLAVARFIARIDDPLIEITLTTIAAYGSFILAENLHASGVLATVAAGLSCGSYGTRGMSPSTRVAVESFWQYVAFALNSIVFLLIGFQVRVGVLVQSWGLIAVAYAAMMVARVVVVFVVAVVLYRSRERLPWRWAIVLTWGGLRGALSMVLALSLAEDFPERPLIVRVTFGVVVVSILLNGLTIGPLLRRLGLAADAPTAIKFGGVAERG